MDYRQAGVDTELADKTLSGMSGLFGRVKRPEVKSGVGGFAALWNLGAGRYLAAGCDGVGTKLKWAFETNRHDTIGIDLVAMSVNDILCVGARPMFFLDYFSTGKLEPDVLKSVVTGVVEGCAQSNCALIGGETAEMPGMYTPGEYDLAGFAVGDVRGEEIPKVDTIKPGDRVIGLSSTGPHSNGYSLLRKLFSANESQWVSKLMAPTRIYTDTVFKVRAELGEALNGICHVTGGGLKNLIRLNARVGFDLKLPGPGDFANPNVSDVWSEVEKRADCDRAELYRTFNMGIGMYLIVDPKLVSGDPVTAVENICEGTGIQVFDCGETTNKAQEVHAKGMGKVV